MCVYRVYIGTSYHAMSPKLEHIRQELLKDPAILSVAVFAGGRGVSNSSMMLIELLPLEDRDVSANQVVDRLRGKLQSVPGARLFLTPQQDIFVGGGLGDRKSVV